MPTESVWLPVSGLHAVATSQNEKFSSTTWTTSTTWRELRAQLPALMSVLKRIIQQLPVPGYAVCADAVAVDIRESVIAVKWRGFAQQRPRILYSRQNTKAMGEAMWPRPFEWRWAWHFDPTHHLRNITMTIIDARRQDYPLASWTVADGPVAAKLEGDTEGRDDLLISSRFHSQWLGIALQLLFTKMLSAPEQWLNPMEQKVVGHDLANAAGHHWLKRWPLFLLLSPIFLGIVLLRLQADPAAGSRWLWAVLTVSPFFLGSGGYAWLQSAAWKKIGHLKVPPAE